MKPLSLLILLILPAALLAQEAIEPPYYAYDSVTTKPYFTGGTTAMNAWIDSTKTTINTTDTGTVQVWFVVEKDGIVNNVRAIQGTGKSLDAEAERIVSSMPAWIPGKKNGADVATEVVIEVKF